MNGRWRKNTDRYFHLVLVICFLLALSMPVLLLIVGPKEEIAANENRKLAVFPELSLKKEAISTFPDKFEVYFNDHFGARKHLIRMHHYMKAMWFKRSPIDKVLIGKDDWLFFTENGMVDSYRGIHPLSDLQLKSIKDNLEKKQAILARLGIKYVFVVAPNKQSIYPEYLPEYITRIKPQTRLDQIVAFLQQYSTVELVDLRKSIRDEKDGGLLYLTKDTHWNQWGAFIAYQSIIRTLQKLLPDLPLLVDEDIVVQMKQSVRGDLAGMLNLKDVLTEKAPFVSVRNKGATMDTELNGYLQVFNSRYNIKYQRPFAHRNAAGKYRAVVFRDSFFTDVIPVMSESFAQIIYFYEGYNDDLLLMLGSQKFKPDVVIEEIVERNL